MLQKLQKLGEKLVKCNLNCEGINNDPTQGIIPRCLLSENRKGKKKCIIVGLNPGKCKKSEREYYRRNGIKYASVQRYFSESKLHNRAYFARTRNLISQLGFDGDILWTDLAKCECLGKNGKLPAQTLRVCINKFLKNEIELFKGSTIFALGNVAFNFCALRFPEYFIVGIPHPSSYGNFDKLKKKISTKRSYFIKNLSKQKDKNNNYRAIRLSDIQTRHKLN